MSKKSIWSLKLNTASLVLIPASIGINYIGKLFAEALKLPLWLDNIGTILAAALAGPIVGGLCGLIKSIVFGLTANPIALLYGFTGLGIGITAGLLIHKGWFKSISKATLLGLVVGLVAVIISTPLNVLIWGGQTGNVWADAAFAYLIANNTHIFIASFVGELLTDIPDKIIIVLIAYAIYKSLPKRIVGLYSNDEEIQTLQ